MTFTKKHAMPYIEGRVVHDVDSYIFESPGTVERFASQLGFSSAEADLAACAEAEQRAFSCDNIVDFMGRRLAPVPRQ